MNGSLNTMAAEAADRIISQEAEIRRIATDGNLADGYIEDVIRRMIIVEVTKVGQDVRHRIGEAMATL